MNTLMQQLVFYLASILIGIDKGGVPGLGALAVIFAITLLEGSFTASRILGLSVPILAVADISSCVAYRDAVRYKNKIYLYKI